jgi:hypothetical protein
MIPTIIGHRTQQLIHPVMHVVPVASAAATTTSTAASAAASSADYAGKDAPAPSNSALLSSLNNEEYPAKRRRGADQHPNPDPIDSGQSSSVAGGLPGNILRSFSSADADAILSYSSQGGPRPVISLPTLPSFTSSSPHNRLLSRQAGEEEENPDQIHIMIDRQPRPVIWPQNGWSDMLDATWAPSHALWKAARSSSRGEGESTEDGEILLLDSGDYANLTLPPHHVSASYPASLPPPPLPPPPPFPPPPPPPLLVNHTDILEMHPDDYFDQKYDSSEEEEERLKGMSRKKRNRAQMNQIMRRNGFPPPSKGKKHYNRFQPPQPR